jgi:hypothetical protein
MNLKSLKLAQGFLKKSPLHTFLRNQQLKFPRSFYNEPILIRVKGVYRIKVFWAIFILKSKSHDLFLVFFVYFTQLGVFVALPPPPHGAPPHPLMVPPTR